jgi:hypothetical protein
MEQLWDVTFATHLRLTRGSEIYRHRHRRTFTVKAPDRMAAIDAAEPLYEQTPYLPDTDPVLVALFEHGFTVQACEGVTMPACDPHTPAG